MGSTWIRVPTENSKDIISSFKTANVRWPSSTKAELLAIYLALLTTEENCTVKIFTDSQNAINQINKFKYETSVGRKNKTHNHILIEAIMKIVKSAKIDLKLTKVKVHDGIWGNEIVDDLAKQGLYDNRIITRDIGDETNFRLSWYGHKVEHNNIKFVKMLNNVKMELKENNLNRMKNLEAKYNKKVTFDILNKDNKITKEKKGKFLFIKGNKYRTFKVKKLFNELLTLENLKRRMPKLYKKNMLCPRCNKKEENTKHIWECKKNNNEITILENKIYKQMLDDVKDNEDFIYKTELTEKLYKYSVLEKNLIQYHNVEKIKIL